MVISNLQAERYAPVDIPANFPDSFFVVFNGEFFYTLHQRVDRVGLFLEKSDFFSIAFVDGMVPIFHDFLGDDDRLA